MSEDNLHRESPPTKPRLALGIAIFGGLMAALLRVVPHPPNFSAVGGLGLFGGARLRTWQAYLLPLGIMVLSDLILWAATGFDYKYSLAHLSRGPVYAGFMIYVLIGRWLCNRESLASVWLAATLGGLQFFVLTNFCEWLLQPLVPGEFHRYSRDFAGLAECFTMALGFYQQEIPAGSYPFMTVTNFPAALLVWTILGDLLFTTIYMLVYVRLARRPQVAEQTPVPTPTA